MARVVHQVRTGRIILQEVQVAEVVHQFHLLKATHHLPGQVFHQADLQVVHQLDHLQDHQDPALSDRLQALQVDQAAVVVAVDQAAQAVDHQVGGRQKVF